MYVGLDLGGTNVRAAVVNGDGHILGQEKHRLQSREPPQVAEAIVRAAKTACGAAGLPFGEPSWVEGLGRRLDLDLEIRPRLRPRRPQLDGSSPDR